MLYLLYDDMAADGEDVIAAVMADSLKAAEDKFLAAGKTEEAKYEEGLHYVGTAPFELLED